MSEDEKPPVYQKLKKIREKEGVDIKKESKFLIDDLELRNYQAQMVLHMLLMKKFVVGDATGLGKTVEAIATMAYLWEKKPDMKCIVITNTSAMRQWGGEIDKFMDGVNWTLVEGGPDSREEIYEDYFENYDSNEPEFLIVNYHRIRRDKRDFLQYARGEDYTIIADEATAFKNSSSKTHHAIKALAKHCQRIYGMTATLIKNNLKEGFGIFKVINPSLFPSKTGFHRNYCVTRMQKIRGSNRKIPIVVGHSKKHIRKFKERIDPYYLGRAKHEVADELPVLTTKDLQVPLNRDQWQYYLQAVEGFLSVNEDVEPEEGEEQEEIEDMKETNHLTELIYTQEIVDSPYLIGNHVGSEKETYLLDLLDNELKDEKVIIFTRFKEMVNRLTGILENRGMENSIEKKNGDWQAKDDDDIEDGSYSRITGSESDKAREAGRKAFTENDNTNIIFLTMAGAEAINLQQARIMIFYDMPWSAGDYLQLIGRMIRIGSPHESVYSLHLISEGPDGEETIDNHVRETLDDKMELIENVIGERVQKESSIDEEDEDDLAIDTESESKEIFEKLKEAAKDIAGG
jgi:SNF2 family DNA or RNA helicase